MKGSRGLDSTDAQFAQSPLHRRDGFVTRLAMDDNLGNHRIVMRRDGVTRMRMGVDPHAKTAGKIHRLDLTRTRLEIAIGILSVDPTLNCGPSGFDLALSKRELLACGDEDLRFDQVDTRNHFAHRMLDLDSSVDFDEVEIILLIDDELYGRCIVIIRLLDHPDRCVAHGFSRRFGKPGRWALLDEFLMPTLDRTISLMKMHDIAVLVCDDLDLDMPRPIDVTLKINPRVPKGRLGLCLRLGDRVLQRSFVDGDPHPFAPTPCGGLDQNRKTNLASRPDRVLLAFNQSITARDDRDPRGDRHLPGGIFIAKLLHSLRTRTDELKIATAAHFVEMRIFR